MTLKTVFANATERRQFDSGDTIFAEGQPGHEMFGVITGKVELRRGDDVITAIGPDATFGEMAIIDDTPRSLTAVAVEPSTVAVINRHTFLFLVHETPTFALDVMRSLIGRIRAYNDTR